MSHTKCFEFAALSLVLLGALAGCHSSVADAPPAGQRGRGGGGRGGFNLLADETVQKELALTTGQKESIQRISDDFRKSMSGLSQEDRQSKIPELRKAMDDKIDAVLNATQRARIKEIRLQVQGPAALATKEVAEALKLTADQVKQIEEVNKGLDKARRETFQFGGGMNNDVREQLTILQTEADEKILALLDSEQAATFERMQGAKFDFPAGGGGGGFGGGGFGGGGSGGGGFGGGGPGGGGPGGGGGNRGNNGN